jgi:hypothetical protein
MDDEELERLLMLAKEYLRSIVGLVMSLAQVGDPRPDASSYCQGRAEVEASGPKGMNDQCLW